MSLQFADWNADGHKDLITATFEGTAFVCLGSKEGFAAPQHLTDRRDRNIVLSLYYDMEANEYANAERSPKGLRNPEDHCVSALAFDWDQDGDLDLLLGAKEGRLYLQRNEGTPKAPKLTGENEPLTAGGKPFNVPGGLTAARPVDWDGDGKIDLVCGGFEGGVWLYRNLGGEGEPQFAAPSKLLAQQSEGKAPFPSRGIYADPVDYDGDGDLDLLVGGYAMIQPVAPTLDAAQKEQLVTLRKQLETIEKEHSQKVASIMEAASKMSEEEAEKFRNVQFRGPEMQKLMEREDKLRKSIDALDPRPKRTAGLWLVERVTSKD